MTIFDWEDYPTPKSNEYREFAFLSKAENALEGLSEKGKRDVAIHQDAHSFS
jgi:hypothetical protein